MADNRITSRFQRIEGATHPILEDFAEQFYVRTPATDWPEGMQPTGGVVWEREPPEVRVAFRERAIRFMNGEVWLLPWTYPIGTGPYGVRMPRIV